MTSLPDRLAWHARTALRASLIGILAAAPVGFAWHLLIPVRGWSLSLLVAAGAGIAAMAAIAVAQMTAGDRPLPQRRIEPAASLEGVGAADQVAHGLARACLLLASFGIGLGLGAVLRGI